MNQFFVGYFFQNDYNGGLSRDSVYSNSLKLSNHLFKDQGPVSQNYFMKKIYTKRPKFVIISILFSYLMNIIRLFEISRHPNTRLKTKLNMAVA